MNNTIIIKTTDDHKHLITTDKLKSTQKLNIIQLFLFLNLINKYEYKLFLTNINLLKMYHNNVKIHLRPKSYLVKKLVRIDNGFAA